MSQFRRKTPMKSYDFCYGLGVNYVDMQTGIMYHIQEYKEAIERGESPKGIRMTQGDSGPDLGYMEDYKLRTRMEDPPIDPRYAPETPEEHRRSRE